MTTAPETRPSGPASDAPFTPHLPTRSPPSELESAAVAANAAATFADAAATEAAVAADAAEDAALPNQVLPIRARTRSMLAMLVVIAVLYTCFLARELIVPILLAVFIGLCGNPLVARLQKLWVPRWIGALLVVAVGLSATVYGTTQLLTPASQWMQSAPGELRRHIPKIRELAKPLQEASEASESLQKLGEVGPPAPAPVLTVEQPQRNLFDLLAAAPRALASVLAVVILSFFFMVYGEDLLRGVVTVMPGWHQKRITVDILRSVQVDISRYMLTVSLINLALGFANGVALWLIGFDPYEAAFWGAATALLNFAPYVGPTIGAMALTLAGLMEFDSLGHAMLAPGLFLILHLIESQFVTPLILGKRMSISPVILLLWLFLWGWMWGIAGLLLAVPMLVCFKIVCDRIDALKSWAMMMEP